MYLSYVLLIMRGCIADTHNHYPTSFNFDSRSIRPFGPRTHFFDGKLEA